MARTAVTYNKLVPNGRLADPAGTTIDATLVTNGVVINTADPEHTLIRVSNTAAGAKNVTVRAGSGRDAWMAGAGDLVVSVGASGAAFIGPFTSARFQQTGTKLFVDFEAGTTGTVTVLRIPKAL
jgi:hypothetical protein